MRFGGGGALALINGSGQRDTVLRQALVTCFFKSDSELSPEGRLVLNWLRDTVCEWRENPTDSDAYSGDLIKLGILLGRQSVYDKLMQEMYLMPELERLEAIRDTLARQRLNIEEEEGARDFRETT